MFKLIYNQAVSFENELKSANLDDEITFDFL